MAFLHLAMLLQNGRFLWTTLNMFYTQDFIFAPLSLKVQLVFFLDQDISRGNEFHTALCRVYTVKEFGNILPNNLPNVGPIVNPTNCWAMFRQMLWVNANTQRLGRIVDHKMGFTFYTVITDTWF